MKKVIASAIVFNLALFSSAQAQLGGFLVTASIGELSGKITDDINGVINQLEYSGSALSFTARSDLLVVLRNVDLMANEFRDKTFQDLNQSQQTVFLNAFAAIDKAKEGTEASLGEVRKLTDQVGADISRLPFVEKSPLVTHFSPSMAISNQSAYRISVRGSRLGEGNPTLSIPNATCDRATKLESKLEFECKGEAFAVSEAKWLDGKLTVFSKDRSFFIGPRKHSNYDVSLGIIPSKMGDYSFEVSHEKSAEIRKERSGSNRHRNDHCQGNRNVGWNYTPEAGCKIDISSVKPNGSSSSNSTYHGMSNLTVDGFRLTGVVRNNGSCGPFGVPHDGRGSVSVSAKWVDVCEETVNEVTNQIQGELIWGKDLLWKLRDHAANPIGFNANVSLSDGTIKSFTGAEVNEWFDVNYDVVNQIVSVKPKSPHVAYKP